jgi:DeoR/GlpR family transcriptional regulator of sugar metabolism
VIPIERRLKLLERVAAEQVIQVSELARDFGVSEMTIRRDIRRLERDGFIRQSYGGATAHVTRSLELAVNSRAFQHAREKRLIALAASEVLEDASVVFIGIGTTCEQLAQFIPARPELTVVTGSLPVASLLGTRPVRVVVLGGQVRRDELSVVGPQAWAGLARWRFDVAVMGAAGITARWGITDLDSDDAEINRLALEQAALGVVIADGSKVGRAAPAIVAPAAAARMLFTDASAPQTELDALREVGLEIHIAGVARDPLQNELRNAALAGGRTGRTRTDGTAGEDLRDAQARHRDAALPGAAGQAVAR